MAGIIIAGVVGAAFGFIMAVLCVSAGSHYEEYEGRDDEEQGVTDSEERHGRF